MTYHENTESPHDYPLKRLPSEQGLRGYRGELRKCSYGQTLKLSSACGRFKCCRRRRPGTVRPQTGQSRTISPTTKVQVHPWRAPVESNIWTLLVKLERGEICVGGRIQIHFPVANLLSHEQNHSSRWWQRAQDLPWLLSSLIAVTLNMNHILERKKKACPPHPSRPALLVSRSTAWRAYCTWQGSRSWRVFFLSPQRSKVHIWTPSPDQVHFVRGNVSYRLHRSLRTWSSGTGAFRVTVAPRSFFHTWSTPNTQLMVESSSQRLVPMSHRLVASKEKKKRDSSTSVVLWSPSRTPQPSDMTWEFKAFGSTKALEALEISSQFGRWNPKPAFKCSFFFLN